MPEAVDHRCREAVGSMRREEVHELVVGLLAAPRWLDPSMIRADSSLVDDLDVDSLDATELLVAVHQRTGVKLDLDSLDHLRTVEDVVTFVTDRLGLEPGSVDR